MRISAGWVAHPFHDAYLPGFGVAGAACAGVFGGDVVVALVGAGTLTLKVGKFALSAPICGLVGDFFDGSAIILLLWLAWGLG
jgi:hypothetical protein